MKNHVLELVYECMWHSLEVKLPIIRINSGMENY